MYKLVAKCSCCGREGTYVLDEEEYYAFWSYQIFGRDMGPIQELFQKYRHGSEVELLINTATGFVSVRNVVDENG